jgi:hypothetical protein
MRMTGVVRGMVAAVTTTTMTVMMMTAVRTAAT